mmetsp:Transcript_43475/g.69972  ORF Transcript_43475/g.69972 Transcript_43475/m.69972 type:complete len:251 (+) Transcript_43475:313-1065(+)
MRRRPSVGLSLGRPHQSRWCCSGCRTQCRPPFPRRHRFRPARVTRGPCFPRHLGRRRPKLIELFIDNLLDGMIHVRQQRNDGEASDGGSPFGEPSRPFQDNLPQVHLRVNDCHGDSDGCSGVEDGGVCRNAPHLLRVRAMLFGLVHAEGRVCDDVGHRHAVRCVNRPGGNHRPEGFAEIARVRQMSNLGQRAGQFLRAHDSRLLYKKAYSRPVAGVPHTRIPHHVAALAKALWRRVRVVEPHAGRKREKT